MRSRWRRAVVTGAWVGAGVCAAVAAGSWSNVRVPLGSSATVWLAKGTLRVEGGASAAAGWRGHPWDVRVGRRGVVEVGQMPLAGMAAALVVVALIARREGFAKGTCAGCGYSREGLKGEVCPECGGEEWIALWGGLGVLA